MSHNTEGFIGFSSWHVCLVPPGVVRLVSAVGEPVVWRVVTHSPIERFSGLFAVKDLDYIPWEATDIAQIVGVVKLFGTVEEYEGGYRSSDAVVKTLFQPSWKCIWHKEVLATHLAVVEYAETMYTRVHALRPNCAEDIKLWTPPKYPPHIAALISLKPIIMFSTRAEEALEQLLAYYEALLTAFPPSLATRPRYKREWRFFG